MNWFLPPTVSTYGPEIDRMYYVILVITGVVFLLTEAALIWFIIRYRHKEGRKAAYIHGNVTAEVVWTIIPFVIVVGIALASNGMWQRIRSPDRLPADAYEVQVMAKQFEWTTTYAGADGELGTDDDFTARNALDVPVDRAVIVHLGSEDVIHSFFLPEMRVKQDAVPGMTTAVWFEATESGEYVIGCAELCGTGHTRMRGTLTVHAAGEFEAWEAERIARAAERGDTGRQAALADGSEASAGDAAR